MPNRTCIAVTHRPAAIALCDWQLQMEGGKLKAIAKPCGSWACGTPDSNL